MKVIATIQYIGPGASALSEPTPVQWYNGDNLAEAISAMVQASVRYDNDPGMTKTLDVTLQF